jgi:hypothetical protein
MTSKSLGPVLEYSADEQQYITGYAVTELNFMVIKTRILEDEDIVSVLPSKLFKFIKLVCWVELLFVRMSHAIYFPRVRSYLPQSNRYGTRGW